MLDLLRRLNLEDILVDIVYGNFVCAFDDNTEISKCTVVLQKLHSFL